MRGTSHRSRPSPITLVLLAAFPTIGRTQAVPSEPVRIAMHTALERVDVTGSRPHTLPIEIPTTTESIGDYDHAVLATRASGTGNSARSLVYADGILLSNLLGNGASFTPRWGLVTPEEIERVDVLYGPFSAAYPGNSAGAIVDYVTRLPKRFEAHVKLQAFTQHYTLYGTDERYSGHQASASLGNKVGDWSWWINLNRLDSQAQPIGFATKLVSAGTAGSAGTAVSGAVEQQNPRGQDWVLFGATGQTHTVQDHGKLKLAYDLSATLRASYTFGYWRNDADRSSQSFVRDASGAPVWSGNVNVANRSYTLAPADLAPSQADLEHHAHGLSLKSNRRDTWDWEVAASAYRYVRDRVATPTAITDLKGTGWNTLALKGIWRPAGAQGAHVVEAGLQRDAFQLRTLVSNGVSSFDGNTALVSLWAQDAWHFSPGWRAVLGARVERWRAHGGAINGIGLDERRETHVSPKAALSWRASEDWTVKASLGRAVRMPTVAELYQGAMSGGVIVNNDPNLKPEKSWTSELSAEHTFGNGLLRSTLFLERTVDALYSQTNVTVTPNVTNIQNVDTIRTRGLELVAQADDVLTKGLELNTSLTYADSIIVRNDKFPASVGKWQPRVPRWRATLLAAYTFDERWSGSLGARHSGRQYGQLDNSDTNDRAYTGFSRFFVVDARLRYRFDRQWSAAVGVDNLNNQTYWAFHPYPQRTLYAELRFDL